MSARIARQSKRLAWIVDWITFHSTTTERLLLGSSQVQSADFKGAIHTPAEHESGYLSSLGKEDAAPLRQRILQLSCQEPTPARRDRCRCLFPQEVIFVGGNITPAPNI